MSYTEFWLRRIVVDSVRLVQRLKRLPDEATLLRLWKEPFWEVSSYQQLQRLIGAFSFFNSDNALLFRGQPRDYAGQLKPSAARTPPLSETEVDHQVDDAIKLYRERSKDAFLRERNVLEVEAALQHYGYRTRMLDVTTDLDMALWFALFDLDVSSVGERSYGRYVLKRDSHDNAWGVIYILICPRIPRARSVFPAEELVAIDLRAALPSTSLRPHAQSAIMIGSTEHALNDLDFRRYCIATIRVPRRSGLGWIGLPGVDATRDLFVEEPTGMPGGLFRAGSRLAETTLFPRPHEDSNERDVFYWKLRDEARLPHLLHYRLHELPARDEGTRGATAESVVAKAAKLKTNVGAKRVRIKKRGTMR